MKTERKEDALYLSLEGRIDSTNAPAVQDELLAAKGGETKVVLDAENLQYISSAGLRVILRLKKDCPDLKIVNVSNEVYDIFEMTGFTEMIAIEKAYRRLSVEGCEVIGRGANGEVYRLDPDTIIKVYLNPDSLPDIHRERELARRAFVLGIPTAIPYDVVKVGDGYGSVFELLSAKSFSKILAEEPERLDEIADLYVKLLKKIHSTTVQPEDMPDMREMVLGWANFVKDYLPEDKGNKLVQLVEAVPVSHQMMHGDYHTKNVMLQDGEVLLIDMDTLCQGDPVFEFASVFNAYIGFCAYEPSLTGKFLGLPPELPGKLWQKTLQLYFNTTDRAFLQSVEEKASLIGYTRLMRRLILRNGLETAPEEVAFYQDRILNLLDKVDTLKLQ